jgi:hypothetical protein
MQGRTIQELRVTPRPESRTQIPLPVFQIHSGFWLNLHHTLYEQARLRLQRPTRRPPAAPPADLAASTPLSPEERAAWEAALAAYMRTWASRDLLFDGDMPLIKNRLAELEDCPDLSGRSTSRCASGLRPELIATLEQAAPVYRARWWPAHDRTNREWIARVIPLVHEIGASLATQLANLFHADWPAARLRVDVSVYAGLAGSYTSLDPFHFTISSTDERNQGSGAVEVLFFESSQVLALGLRDVIAREFRNRGKPIPRELWSAMLCYTVALMVRTGPHATPPGQALLERGWPRYRTALDAYWKPFVQTSLRGQSDPEDLERAVARVVSWF